MGQVRGASEAELVAVNGFMVDSETRGNGLSEADPHVPAKLAEQRLDRGEEAEALSVSKGQVRAVPADDISAQRTFVHQVFGLAA